MTNDTSQKNQDPDKYQHTLFFGTDWTEETEEQAEKMRRRIQNWMPSAETLVATEEGKPVELTFWTWFFVDEKTRDHVVYGCKPQSYSFNAEDL